MNPCLYTFCHWFRDEYCIQMDKTTRCCVCHCMYVRVIIYLHQI